MYSSDALIAVLRELQREARENAPIIVPYQDWADYRFQESMRNPNYGHAEEWFQCVRMGSL